MSTVSNIKRKAVQWKWADTEDINNLGVWQPDHIGTCCSCLANYSCYNLLSCAKESQVEGKLKQDWSH